MLSHASIFSKRIGTVQRKTKKNARAMTRDFVADHQPSRYLQQHRRSPQVQACRRPYQSHLATVLSSSFLDPLK